MRLIRAAVLCLCLALLTGCTPQKTDEPALDDDARAALQQPTRSPAPPPGDSPGDVRPNTSAAGARSVSVQFYLCQDVFSATGPGTPIKGTSTNVHLKTPHFMDESAIASAAPIKGPEGDAYHVQVNFTDAGAQIMQTVTESNTNGQIAIVIDGDVVVAPRIRGAIGKAAHIAGRFTQAEAVDIARRLNARP